MQRRVYKRQQYTENRDNKSKPHNRMDGMEKTHFNKKTELFFNLKKIETPLKNAYYVFKVKVLVSDLVGR